ncbi:MAG: SGNH/GDSL hydrolase family protein, partial [Candidatus Nanopelagicales bacterium]
YVVIGVGGMDQLPASVPTWLRDSLPYVRPGGLRRRLRRAYRDLTPGVIRATGGRLRQLPQDATDRYLTRIIQTIRVLRPDVPIVLLAPSPYRSPYYPSNRHHAGASTAAHRLARALDVGLVDPESAVLPGLRDGSANPDGMHWSWAAHRHVGRALAEALAGRQR